MQDLTALRVAIDILQVPSRMHATRSKPLPDGVGLLLSVAAGDEQVTANASRTTARSPEFLLEAAQFFVEQILLSPTSDSYRILGADRTATAIELRRNMALLLKILHPDHYQNVQRSIFAGRVTEAWNNLKTLERRNTYDAGRDTHAEEEHSRVPANRAAQWPPAIARHSQSSSRPIRRRRPLRRALLDFLAHFRA
ncbi:J domain-containing protein [Hyphomicrobium facile]|uniref:DnaJ domain-containing protein n=1 Tax=Hyphomicrobium facile TaxID=51670 RepID=A0A1I7NDM8_9HYPH|nr:DnaJ domain-containing protein [Hyphomicrobium facile]SFV32762.1 DnaJ domain-containing protein [Hyphomicrobium facile]